MAMQDDSIYLPKRIEILRLVHEIRNDMIILTLDRSGVDLRAQEAELNEIEQILR